VSQKEKPTSAYLTKHSILPTPLPLNVDILYDFFLLNSQWRLEINKSSNDLDFISVTAILLNSNQTSPSHEHLCKVLKLSQTHEKQLQLKLNINFYLFNREMNELFARHSVEANLDLKKFINLCVSANLKANRKAKSFEKFKIDKLCKIKELLCWLNARKSDDFCLLAEFKVFAQLGSDLIDSTVQSSSRFKPSKLNLHSSSLLHNSSHLLFSFKHVWMIKNWRNFLMPGSACHTFMSDADIMNIFSTSNLSQNCSSDQSDQSDSAPPAIKFGKLRSKLFSLVSNQDQAAYENCEAHDNAILSKNKIESLLKDVKWKLQLYPNGYNTQYEQNLSLFVNFSQLTDQLAQFSSSSSIKKSSSSSSIVKSIEETFYDSNDNLGLILLIKSPSSLSNLSDNNQNLEFEEFDDVSMNDLKASRKKHANCETFVKASFQIAILDSKGKKVDKCQSEKQLFELFGSWGYKEYMTVKDLFDFKEKYLTNECLNLNCKIVLFYTLTSKCYPDLLNENLSACSSTSSSRNSSSSKLTADLEATEKANLNLASELRKGLIDESNNSHNQRRDSVETSASFECNTLLYDLRRLLIKSHMFDLIVQAPIRLEHELAKRSKHSNKPLHKQFKAHKLILSIRSEVFERMFNAKHATLMLNEMNKTADGVDLLEIVDFDALTVEIFLNYLYTDKMEVNLSHLIGLKRSEIHLEDENERNEVELDLKEIEEDADEKHEKQANGESQSVYENLIKQKKTPRLTRKPSKYLNDELRTTLLMELFKLADKYCVYRLKKICELQLVELVNCETLVELLVLAYLHSSLKLKRVCLNFLVDNVSNIITQPNWAHLEKHYPSLLAEAFRALYLNKNTSVN